MNGNTHLIENSAKNYLFNVLQKCHNNRVSMYYYVLNVGVLILFLGITGYILYNCNKYKLSDYEKQQKMWKDQQYIVSKIRYYKEHNKNLQQSSMSGITNLPFTNMNM